MEEDYLHIAKTNIRPEPYDLLRKVFHKKDYEATTRVFIDALVTSITQHNMLHFFCRNSPQIMPRGTANRCNKKPKVQRTDTFRKSETQQLEAAKESGGTSKRCNGKPSLHYQRYKRPHRCGGGETSQISDQSINNAVYGTAARHPTGD